MWLQDLLPQDLPNARVMTYGYNSNIVEDASISSIRDFAKGLLNDLDGYRTEEVFAKLQATTALLANCLIFF
jgi:hypothetical protein